MKQRRVPALEWLRLTCLSPVPAAVVHFLFILKLVLTIFLIVTHSFSVLVV